MAVTSDIIQVSDHLMALFVVYCLNTGVKIDHNEIHI